ncbi:MAG: hydrogenase maturation protease [Dehalococcoidales bacterium]
MTDTNTGTGKILVMGLGNVILGDEGFGVHVARRLKEVDLPENVAVREGGVGGFDLLGYLDGIRQLLVVDVMMMMDAPPGEIFFFRPGPELSEPGKTILSFHQVGVLDLIKMWGLLGFEPDTYFLVTCPEKMEWGMKLSPSLETAAERAVALIRELCVTGLDTGVGREKHPCIP